MRDKWYDKGYRQVETILKTDTEKGLTKKQVAKRRARDGMNDVYQLSSTSFRSNLIHILTDLPSILLLFTVLIAVIFEKTVLMLAAISVLLVFYAVMLYTYEKSQRVLEGMDYYALPTAKVLREGKLYLIKQRQLVQGDIIYLTAGDIVPCDARLIETDGMDVREYSLTGYPKAVRKNADFVTSGDIAPHGQRNMVFASTIVSAGRGKAIACGIGKETLVCKMRKNMPIVLHDKLAVLTKLRKFSRAASLVSCFSILVLTVADLIIAKRGTGLVDSFLLSLSLSVSSLTEFLPIFGFILIACGVFSAVRRNGSINSGALIKNSDKLRVMKDLDCLIVPKEGSFTTSEQKIEKVFVNGDTVSVGEHGFKREASKALRYALLSTGLYGSERLRLNNENSENIYTPEENAILRLSEELGIYNVELETKYPLVEHRDAGPDNFFETTLYSCYDNYMIALRGDPSLLISRCTTYSENGKVLPMTQEKASAFRIAGELLSKQTYRVVAVATKTVPYNNLGKIGVCQHEMNFEGLLAIREPSTVGIAKTVARCRDAGIRVILMTDDVGDYNLRFAESVGILKDGDRVLTGSEMAGMQEGLYYSELGTYTLCQGLDVSQKRRLIRDLKDEGAKVGVLCRRLEELTVLREADVSFAQSVTLSDKAGTSGYSLTGRNTPVYSKKGGEMGCEALRFVSDVIVSEADEKGGGFRAIAESVSSAGMICRNLTRMFRHIVMTQTFRTAAVVLSIAVGVTYLKPIQLLFSGMIVDLMAILSMAFSKPDTKMLYERSYERFDLDRIGRTALFSVIYGLIWSVLTAGSMIVGSVVGVIRGSDALCTAVFLSLILSQQVLRLVLSSGHPIFRHGMVVSGISALTDLVLAAFIVCASVFPRFGNLFGVVRLSLPAWGFVLIPVALMFAIFEIGKLFVKKKD
ncbi:MAG: cation transporting ATPase C-terminal domain-containing protein [Lachnospiraceae bacterium]|nr:cation transporting ATPase C-terminal domain-containing protein [Lachnospiraceae bacterium]